MVWFARAAHHELYGVPSVWRGYYRPPWVIRKPKHKCRAPTSDPGHVCFAYGVRNVVYNLHGGHGPLAASGVASVFENVFSQFNPLVAYVGGLMRPNHPSHVFSLTG